MNRPFTNFFFHDSTILRNAYLNQPLQKGTELSFNGFLYENLHVDLYLNL